MYRAPLLLSLALISSTTIAQAQATKIESQLLVTGETGMQFSISPHGGHVAAVTQKGSRWVVIYDGTPGPLFDEIGIPNSGGGASTINWSPDGSRYAYVGRVGQMYSVMVDGKEQLKVPATNETGVAGIQSGPSRDHFHSRQQTHLLRRSGRRARTRRRQVPGDPRGV